VRKIIHIVHWEMSGIFEVAKTLAVRGGELGDTHEIIVLRKNKKLSDKVLSIFRMMSCIYKLFFIKNSIIHAHSFLPFLLTVFTRNSDVVLTFHNAYPFLKEISLKSRLKCNFLKFVINSKSPKLTAVGKLVSEYVSSGTGFEAMTIQNGMKISAFDFTLPDKPIRYIGSVGRLDEQKNYTELIKAIVFVSSNIELKIAGEGIQRQRLEALIERNEIKNIKLIGFINNIISFHNTTDAFICSSIFEGCNLSIIESILLGKPVISTNVGVAYDFPELDLIRMETNEQSMTKEINKWLELSLDELQATAKKNRKLAEHLFNINTVYDIYRDKIWELGRYE